MPLWLSILGVAVAAVGFLGASVVFLRGSKDKGTIETLGRNNDALADRVKLLEASELQLQATILVLQERVASLEAERDNLAAQRPSAEVVHDIHERLVKHSEDLTHHDTETRALLMALATQVEELTDADH